MILRILFLAILLCTPAIGAKQGAQPAKCVEPSCGAFDVILLMGQSNATSRGIGGGPDPAASDRQIWQFGRGNADHRIVPAKEPLMNVTYASQGVGFALPFARQYRDGFLKPGRAVLIVPAAKGATSVARQNAYWQPGGLGHRDVRERMRSVLRAFPKARLAAILWHQGESDWDSNQAIYRKRTTQLLTGIRGEFDSSGKVPIILGELAESYRDAVSAEPVNNSIRYLARTIPNAGLALSASLPAQRKIPGAKIVDISHFSAEAQLEFSKRYFCAYARLAQRSSRVARLPYCERFTDVPTVDG